MMYDSIRDSMMVALSSLGYDINTTNPEELAEAGELLLAQKPLVRGYGTDNIKDDMIGGSVALAIDYPVPLYRQLWKTRTSRTSCPKRAATSGWITSWYSNPPK